MIPKLTIVLLGIFIDFRQTEAHGRIMEPPMRASLWRFEEFEYLDPLVMYDDDAFWCGGYVTQHQQNGGKCGVCGDNYADPTPRSHEDGGQFGRGIIARNYTDGQVIPIKIELTGAHDGHFEFRLCPRNSRNEPESDACFHKHLLQLADGSGFKMKATRRKGLYTASYRLPKGIKCSNCIIQWHYRTGNNWGDCGDGTFEVGCGPQETFRGCSDVSIR